MHAGIVSVCIGLSNDPIYRFSELEGNTPGVGRASEEAHGYFSPTSSFARLIASAVRTCVAILLWTPASCFGPPPAATAILVRFLQDTKLIQITGRTSPFGLTHSNCSVFYQGRVFCRRGRPSRASRDHCACCARNRPCPIRFPDGSIECGSRRGDVSGRRIDRQVRRQLLVIGVFPQGLGRA